MGFLAGKKALIVGIASNRSIAYGIAKAMHREGAELAFSYANDKLKPRVEKFAAEFESDIVLPCDVTIDQEIEDLFVSLGQIRARLLTEITSKISIARAFESRTMSVPIA